MAKRTKKAAGLAAMTTSELAAELARRERQVGTLERKRERLLAQVEEIDAALAEFGSMGIGAREIGRAHV